MALVMGCTSPAEPRAQAVLFVSTNAPVPLQLASDARISPAAAIDTVRVDVLEGLEVRATEYFTLPSPEDWPFSFGVVGIPGGVVRMRIRAFSATTAKAGDVAGQRSLDPRAQVTIDRLVDLDIPEHGISEHGVALTLECVGRSARFASPGQSCIDDSRPGGAPREGLVHPGDLPLPGTSALAVEIPCSSDPTPGRVCIPGGYTVMGDIALVGIDDGVVADAAPLQAAALSPFWMDRTEVTVGLFNQHAAQLKSGLPTLRGTTPDTARCTWLGFDDPENDALPINCITWDTARELCQVLGGDLPSEAQWEHAASGRGEGRSFPWGEQFPSCCAASLDHALSCPGFEAEPVGSHADPGACGGFADVSRDGVLDFAGGVTEWTRDDFQDYDDPCWLVEGVKLDPVCETDAPAARSARGGGFDTGRFSARTALRRRLAHDLRTTAGVRCAYVDPAVGAP